MKLGIEVVGERCKPRPEGRLPLEPPTFTPLHSPAQPPSTPDTIIGEDVRSVFINGYDAHVDRHLLLSSRRRRPATVGANQFPPRACPVWGHSSSPGRDSLDFSSRRKDLTASISAARFEKGKKILISYYDQQGRTNAAPRSALVTRVPLLKNGHADRNNNHFIGHVTGGHCGLGRESDSIVTISKITDRLYHRSRHGSAIEKAFTHDFSQMTPSTDSSPEEERQFGLSSVLSSPSTKASTVSTPMPPLNRSHPFLVTTPSSSQDSLNGGNSSTERTESHVRPLTTSPGKRVHFTVDESVKDRLRFVYAKRRAQTVIGGRRARGEELDTARGRGKTRRKATVAPPVVTGAQDENGSPRLSKMYRKFRMIGHVTACLVRLQAAIEVNSLDRTVRSASEIQWRTLYGQQESEKLAFNKSLFSRERVSTKMPRWALRILEVLPEDRTEQDCRRLHALFRGMRSFGKFTEQIQLSLCRSFSYTCVGESRIVLRRGHIGHNFYFVYSGSVFVNVQDVDGDGNAFIKTEAILGSGDSFGELALLQDIRRTATISVRETCELLVVEKDVFAKVCPKIFEKELMEKQSFISRLPLFSSKWWSAENLRSLCMEAHIQEYKINKIIVEDNALEEWLYICMEGKCQVIRCLSLDTGDDDPPPCRSREPSVVLSEEIIELLASAAVAPQKKDGDSGQDGKAENSKITLLSSLGLEYVHTGKRPGAFIEEIEMEERRKALLATHGPMTLTALMAQQQREGKLGLVYLDVGSLEAEGVFDMGSLIKTPVKRKNSSLLLVSSGARMLRIKKKSFFELASPQAVEHTRTLASKEPTPSETALLESYKEKVTWDNYKHGVVQDVMRSRERAAAHRDLGGKPLNDVDANSWLERSQTSTRLLSALNRFNGMDRKGKKGQGRFHSRDHSQGSAQSEDQGHSQNQDHTQGESDSQNEDGGNVETTEGDSEEQGELNSETEAGKRIFPVIQLDSGPEDTPRGEDPRHHQPLDSVPEEGTSEKDGDGKRPSAVIVRRRSSVGVNNKPNVSGETAFVMRRRVTSYHAPQISISEADPIVVTPEE